jgi:beta-lysine 5,6-aminomutase alpha subunit
MEGSKLGVDAGVVACARETAAQIVDAVSREIAGKTTVSVERTVLRLLGVDGVGAHEVPLPNVVVDRLHDEGKLGRGVAHWIGNAMLHTGRSADEVARMVEDEGLDLTALPQKDERAVRDAVMSECRKRIEAIQKRRDERQDFKGSLRRTLPGPHLYVLTATGNVYEDVVHGLAAAEHGAGTIAVIRSTAQSLLDYVPYGPTTEGHGGTFATQANFRIMREALDAWACENDRYIGQSSFCSGLCMPEIAAMGAIEGLDNMVNDALYGILYRDIHILRTLVDQKISRMINGHFGIVINTGEDNYLRTADPVEAAPSVVASQLINYHLARASGVPDSQIGIGNAFEIHPSVESGLLFELAQAQLTRELFPNCPVKYMPPTKHMNGNPFRTHANDTLFNLVTVATDQAIQTIGVPTEGVFTPHIHDRVLGLESSRYVAHFARGIADEIQFAPGGIVQTRADAVMRGAAAILEQIAESGLFAALERGVFGDVSRSLDEGRGADGIVAVDDSYLNPLTELMLESAEPVEAVYA